MDTHQLNAFITISELGSFSSAAAELGITQSAISKRIALLEAHFGKPLFDRISRRVYLTEAGKALLPRAMRILQEVKDTQRYMSELNGLISGNLSIATSHHIGLHRLPKALKIFTQRYPDVHLQINFIDSEQANPAIIQGEFELALITLPQKFEDNDVNEDGDNFIQQHPLWSDPLAFVANKQHPLNLKRQSKPTLELSELANYPAILPDTNTYTTQLIQDLFDQKKEKLSISTTTNHLDAITMMISVGLGWSVLPLTLINNTIMELPIKSPTLTRQLGCIHHRERTLSNAARAMLKVLKEVSRNEK